MVSMGSGVTGEVAVKIAEVVTGNSRKGIANEGHGDRRRTLIFESQEAPP